MLSQKPKSKVIQDVRDNEELKDLILRAKQGDTEAFAVVYETLYTPLYRYTLSRSGDVEHANDVCQQAFLKFYEALPKYEPTTSPLAYLFTIAKHLLINDYRKSKYVTFNEELLVTYEDDAYDIVQTTHVQHLATAIDSFIPSLSDDEQEVIRLHFYGELSHREIAHILHKEEATIRKIKERALKKLRILAKTLYDRS